MKKSIGRFPSRTRVGLLCLSLAIAGPAFGGVQLPPANSILTIVSGNGQSLVPGVPSAPLELRLTDSTGQPLAGVTVNWVAAPGATNTIGSAATVTAGDGTTSNTLTPGLPDDNIQAIATVQTTGAPLQAIFNLNAGINNRGDLTGQQISVANAIDNACPALVGMDAAGANLTAGEQDFLARCTELVVGAAGAGTPGALQQLATEETSTFGRRAVDASRVQGENVSTRMSVLRHAATRQTGAGFSGLALDLSGLTLVDGNDVLPGGALLQSLLPTPVLNAAGDTADVGFAKAAVWARGTFVTGDQEPTANETGFDFDSVDFTLGFDYRVSSSLFWGFAWGYTDIETNLAAGQGDLDSDGNSFTLYSGWNATDHLSFDGSYTFGRLDHSFRRRVQYSIPAVGGGTTQVDQIALSDPESEDQSLNLGLYYDWIRGPTVLEAHVRASWLQVDIDPYSERPADPAAPGLGMMASVGAQEVDSAVGMLGGSWSKSFSQSWGVVIPNIAFDWFHEFRNDPRSVGAVFLNDPTGTPFFFTTDSPDEDYGNVGAGVSLLFPGGKTVWFYYDGLISHDTVTRHALTAGIRIEL